MPEPKTQTTLKPYRLHDTNGELPMLRDILIRLHEITLDNFHTYRNGVRETAEQKLERIGCAAKTAMDKSPAIVKFFNGDWSALDA